MQLQQQTNFQLLICSWLPCELSYEAVNRQWRAVWVQLANDMRRRVKFYSQPVTYNQLNVRHVVTDHWIWHARSHVESYRRPVNVSVIHWQLDNLLLSVCASAAMWRGQWGGPQWGTFARRCHEDTKPHVKGKLKRTATFTILKTSYAPHNVPLCYAYDLYVLTLNVLQQVFSLTSCDKIA